MKILSLSAVEIWPFGKNKGIPSIYASQKGFVDQGHEVLYLCPAKLKDPEWSHELDGIRIHRFRLPFGINSLAVDHLSRSRFLQHLKASLICNLEWIFLQIYFLVLGWRYARTFKPDLVYVHGLVPAFAGWLVSRRARSKWIVRVYGIRDLLDQWKAGGWRKCKEMRNYCAFTLPADYFIFTKDGTGGEQLAGMLNVPRDKILSWYNGVDARPCSGPLPDRAVWVQQNQLPEDAKIIFSAGRLIPFKGTDRLIKALPRLLEKAPATVCLIAGQGPERGALETLAAKGGVRNSVRFLGTLPHEEVTQLYGLADAVALVSPVSNCSNAMWEAMMCGACIVAADQASIRDILTDRKDAVLADIEDPQNLADALYDVLQDEGLRRRLKEEVCKTAGRVLESWESRIHREIRILEDLVDHDGS